jgi:CDGSH-type Zn-finger protein/truncated hemoglobin YjbI
VTDAAAIRSRAAEFSRAVSAASSEGENARALQRLFAGAHAAFGAAMDVEDMHGVAVRLLDSVLRPLAVALAGDGAQAPQPAPASASMNESAEDGGSTSLEDHIWELAQTATNLRVSLGTPPELLEVTAALQDLACRPAATQIPGLADSRLATLRKMQEGLARAIEPESDGPYLVTNAERLVDWLGCELPARPQMALCRCGASKLKPFCDGSHAQVGFSDAKSPERVPDHRDTYVGQQVTILDNRGTCQHAGYCTDRLSSVFRLRDEPFVHPSGGRMDEIIRAVRDCPSGALSYAIDGIEARDEVDYHGQRPPRIEITKDGPYRITGGIPLHQPGGGEIPRNQGASLEHYALCRCGQSRNKPFCSGMHWHVEFRDPVADLERTPTVFEWAGGLPALTRMTRLFYEKYVPEDPLLAPLFADMSADHPQRVAAWLSEVFCGPKVYSSQYGGYQRMLSQHVGKCISEEMRARWVKLLLQSAMEAGLPNDAEFRSTFSSYIEWGSRLAVENSQPESHPPPKMPMPHWDWNTASGPPGSRISALAPPEEQAEEPLVMPGPDEPVSFEKHIKYLFRTRDRNSMSFAFDLWSHADVTKHAEAILTRLGNGSMPCDGAWPAERVEVFARWVNTGKAP